MRGQECTGLQLSAQEVNGVQMISQKDTGVLMSEHECTGVPLGGNNIFFISLFHSFSFHYIAVQPVFNPFRQFVPQLVFLSQHGEC